MTEADLYLAARACVPWNCGLRPLPTTPLCLVVCYQHIRMFPCACRLPNFGHHAHARALMRGVSRVRDLARLVGSCYQCYATVHCPGVAMTCAVGPRVPHTWCTCTSLVVGELGAYACSVCAVSRNMYGAIRRGVALSQTNVHSTALPRHTEPHALSAYGGVGYAPSAARRGGSPPNRWPARSHQLEECARRLAAVLSVARARKACLAARGFNGMHTCAAAANTNSGTATARVQLAISSHCSAQRIRAAQHGHSLPAPFHKGPTCNAILLRRHAMH